MTRRRITQFLVAGACGSSACASKGQPETLAKVRGMAERESLAIIGWWRSADDGRYLVPTAFTVTGASAGRLLLPDRPYWLSVAANACSVAWVPFSTVSSPLFPGGAAEPLVRFAEDRRAVRTVRFTGVCANQVAISSKAEHIAVIAVIDNAGSRRLIVLNAASAEVEYDLTDLITRFTLSAVYRLQISANGDRLAVASRESFVVIDLPSRKLVLDGVDRFPSLSPRGDTLAFVHKSGSLVVTALATGTKRILMNRWWATAVGIGAWSPDGKFLLAGVRDPIGLFTSLVAIDAETDESAEIMRLEVEGDHGEACTWIKRHFLSA